ncbi:MAG: acetylxylan esterase [Thermogutta sp.]
MNAGRRSLGHSVVWGVVFVAVVVSGNVALGQPRPEWRPLGPLPGDSMLSRYFEHEVAVLRENCLSDIKTRADWEQRCEEYRRQLREMLGLDPWPAKSDLKVTVTGAIDREDFRVEKLYYQSLPGLYVTANLYLPKNVSGRVPAVLYLCGHSQVKIDNVSYGNKTHYHFHAVWFARHGYACLVLDSLQLGEIEGIHHGTYRYGMWWWNNRGYTPAGVEAWNCVRAIDYLQTRPEVDPERIGVTGRSGGGAYSWWIAAIDPRVKVAVPVAGITDLQNHVVDGCVEGHCDCMYFVNTYRWDYPIVAALVAPRPLLIVNGDHDPIFPEDGVRRVYETARKIYRLYDAEDKIGIFITKAAHDDIQPIQEAAFRWIDRHLLGKEREVYDPVEKVFTPQELKVLEKIPEDQLNTIIHDHFVPTAPIVFPENVSQWQELKTRWISLLKEKCFRGWPANLPPPSWKNVKEAEADGIRLVRAELPVQDEVILPIYYLRGADGTPRQMEIELLDQDDWSRWLSGLIPHFSEVLGQDLVTDEEKTLQRSEEAWQSVKSRIMNAPGTMLVLLLPRGIGPTAWNSDAKKRTQIERRFMLIGQTSDGMRIFDIVRVIQSIRGQNAWKGIPLTMKAQGRFGVLACYASVFEPVDKLILTNIPKSHRDGPYILNISRVLEVPQAVLLAADRSRVELNTQRTEDWQAPIAAAKRLGWPEDQLKVSPTQ